MTRRKCRNPACGKPLGSTRHLCHSCGGESFRGERGRGGPTVPMLPQIGPALMTLFDRRSP